MSGAFSLCLLGLAVLLALAAAVWDLRTRTIPNWLNAAIALLAIPFWWASGIKPWPDMMIQLGIGGALFGAFAVAFALGAMGGGDVKFIGALGLWLPLGAVMALLIITSLVGGVLTLVMLARHKLARHRHQLEIPYGVAIAAAGVWLIGEQFLNQFA